MKRGGPIRRTKPLPRTPMPRRAHPDGGGLTVPTPAKPPLKKVSTKRAAVNRDYAKLKAAHMAANPVCERCHAAPATDLHHRANRSASAAALCDPANFVALCRTCPDWAGTNRAAAVAEGFAQWGWDYRARGAA